MLNEYITYLEDNVYYSLYHDAYKHGNFDDILCIINNGIKKLKQKYSDTPTKIDVYYINFNRKVKDLKQSSIYERPFLISKFLFYNHDVVVLAIDIKEIQYTALAKNNTIILRNMIHRYNLIRMSEFITKFKKNHFNQETLNQLSEEICDCVCTDGTLFSIFTTTISNRFNILEEDNNNKLKEIIVEHQQSGIPVFYDTLIINIMVSTPASSLFTNNAEIEISDPKYNVNFKINIYFSLKTKNNHIDSRFNLKNKNENILYEIISKILNNNFSSEEIDNFLSTVLIDISKNCLSNKKLILNLINDKKFLLRCIKGAILSIVDIKFPHYMLFYMFEKVLYLPELYFTEASIEQTITKFIYKNADIWNLKFKKIYSEI
jgi:hypothetical protein